MLLPSDTAFLPSQSPWPKVGFLCFPNWRSLWLLHLLLLPGKQCDMSQQTCGCTHSQLCSHDLRALTAQASAVGSVRWAADSDLTDGCGA